jgi:cell division transport system permease protein
MRTKSKKPTSDKAGRPMRRLRIPFGRLPSIWFAHHIQDAVSSLVRLRGTPIPTLMTTMVIGIALALPGALHVLTRNLERLGEGWEQTAAISVFLKPDIGTDKAKFLARRLAGRSDLETVTLIPPEQALDELRAESGFAEAVEQLETNPLPYVIALRPAQSLRDAASLEGLREVLTALPETDLVRMDTLWVRRFQGVIDLGERAVQVLASILAIGVLLVIGNTIRLEIENRRQEIVIMETVGATHAFIRRPFLWRGVWYGLLGGLIAWFLVSLAILFLQGPVSRLAALYQTDFILVGLGPRGLTLLLGGSLTLGLTGSWISVGRHLAAIEPG